MTFSHLFAIHPFPQLQNIRNVLVTDIEITVYKSFKPIRTHSNGCNIFQHFPFDENKTKGR